MKELSCDTRSTRLTCACVVCQPENCHLKRSHPATPPSATSRASRTQWLVHFLLQTPLRCVVSLSRSAGTDAVLWRPSFYLQTRLMIKCCSFATTLLFNQWKSLYAFCGAERCQNDRWLSPDFLALLHERCSSWSHSANVFPLSHCFQG